MKWVKVDYNENAGSCSYCQKFQDDFSYYIDGQYHYCTIRCFLNYYPNEVLKIIWVILIPNIEQPGTRTRAILFLSKYITERKW